MASGNAPVLRARLASTVEILAVRITHGTFRPHSAKQASSETSPGQPRLAALVIISTQSKFALPPRGLALTTNAGRSRRRGASTKGKGTQMMSPALKIVECRAVRVACPFGKGREVIDKRISSRPRPRHDNLFAVNIPNHIVARLKPKRKANGTGNSRLRFRGDSS